MVEPIKPQIDKTGHFVYDGKCCVCGSNYKIERQNPVKIKGRHLDGMPFDFSIEQMKDVAYCKNCYNVCLSETPVSDIFGIRDKNNDKEYLKILSSNLPDKIKRIKLVEYKFQDTKTFMDYFIGYYLELYWYYDSIADIENRNFYAKKFLEAVNKGLHIRIKIHIGDIQAINGKSFFISEDMILIDIYRRLGQFEDAYKYIENGKRSLNTDSILSSYIQYYNLQKELCDKKDTSRH